MYDLKFIELITDLCYIIGGFYVGQCSNGDCLGFAKDPDLIVWLNINEKGICFPSNLDKAQKTDLCDLATDFGFLVGEYKNEE